MLGILTLESEPDQIRAPDEAIISLGPPWANLRVQTSAKEDQKRAFSSEESLDE